jgi:hypothetical protein
VAHYTPELVRVRELRFQIDACAGQGIALAMVGFALGVVATSQVVPYIYFQF